MPSRVGWKSGEQLEFLLSQESSHKRHQDLNTLDHFWPRVFEGWYDRWPIVATPAMTRRHKTQEDARVMMQKARNKVRYILLSSASLALCLPHPYAANQKLV